MKKLFTISLTSCLYLGAFAQNVGIGTTTPNSTAQLHVDLGTSTTNGLLVTGTLNVLGTVPDLGTGSRIMFYPAKVAFRAGYVSGTQWDQANVGRYSTAMGANTTASGQSSTAMGSNTTASGNFSIAMGDFTTAMGGYSTSIGYSTVASGLYSTAMGISTHASGNSATSMGNITTASGDYSTAIGGSTIASGLYSTAMGDGSTAGGHSSVAMGFTTIANGQSSVAMGQFTAASGLACYSMGLNTTASGDQSFAIGTNLSTNGKKGSCFLGDSDPYNRGVRVIGSLDQFAARFNGGYYLISSNAGADIGVQVVAGGNSWTTASDVRLKENFLPVIGESFLQKIGKMNLTSWNYKTQDRRTFRHYGPMAQDFYKAFGKDDLGTIGCDTLINQQDFLGVNLIAIQALEKRTATLNAENTELKNEVSKLKSRLDKLEKVMCNKYFFY
ncbi:MAG: tail fiber domain-containing protein [Chitinophagaceae bacterium]